MIHETPQAISLGVACCRCKRHGNLVCLPNGYYTGMAMHHKRHRPKNRRAGCLMCKPWKANGAPLGLRMRPNQLRRLGEHVAQPDMRHFEHKAGFR